MPELPPDPRLQQLLQHPALWRGRSVAPLPVMPTGFAALDQALPGGGWPQRGLTEVLTARQGLGELRLWLPALARLSTAGAARWCAFIAPPFQLFAPALAAAGVRLDRLLIVHPPQPLWATEQALRSGACDLVLSWVVQADLPQLRRLTLATEQGLSAGVLFRPARAERDASPAMLRLGVQARPGGLRLRLFKSRGAPQSLVDLPLPAWGADP